MAFLLVAACIKVPHRLLPSRCYITAILYYYLTFYQLLLMCIVYGTRLPAGMFIPSLAGAFLNSITNPKPL